MKNQRPQAQVVKETERGGKEGETPSMPNDVGTPIPSAEQQNRPPQKKAEVASRKERTAW